MNKFTKQEINDLNSSYPWNNSINTSQIKDNGNKNDEFILYATGNASLGSGREYISLPANKIITHQDKIKYNLI